MPADRLAGVELIGLLLVGWTCFSLAWVAWSRRIYRHRHRHRRTEPLSRSVDFAHDALGRRVVTPPGIAEARGQGKSAIEDVGRFRVGMATEDVALAWQLQTAYADVRYEPRALFAMQVPETLPAWWGQRTRWARGLAQVLRENAPIVRDVRARRMWPVWVVGLLSTFWSHLFFLAAAAAVRGTLPGLLRTPLHHARHLEAAALRRRLSARPPAPRRRFAKGLPLG